MVNVQPLFLVMLVKEYVGISESEQSSDWIKADSHIPCRSHAISLPQPCHSPTVLCLSWRFLILCMKFSCYLLSGIIFY
jgi:hypothetical protein